MRILEHCEPRQVFYYFEEIAKIPHGSFHTAAISDYCMQFAHERGLEADQDECHNVVIIKEATEGYEDAEPIIIQGHLDMVCEKESDCPIDFEKEGLSLYVDGDFLKARGTTLGGDDGIAIAYALALLDAKDLPHPRLECVFTTEEEVGMLGATRLDVSKLKGHRMLNIDSDVEGIFLTACAGGVTAECSIPVQCEDAKGQRFALTLHGLQGGHSGSEIGKGRANAILEMGRILQQIGGKVGIRLLALDGGCKDNAIPRECVAEVLAAPEDEGRLMDMARQAGKMLQKEYVATDPAIECNVEPLGDWEGPALDAQSQSKVLSFLRLAPNGIQRMCQEMGDLPETSLNAGIMKMGKASFSVSFSIRSSVKTRKEELMGRLSLLTGLFGGTVAFSGDYPAWEYCKDSAVRRLVTEVYADLFGKKPKMEAIHAGLECGILSEKIPDLDCVSFGPDNFDIHTPNERLSIQSTERVWRFLLEFLKRAR